MADQHTKAITLSFDLPDQSFARPLELHKTLLCAGAD
jgi:hypothetical protein